MKKYLFAAFLFGSAFLGYGQMVLSSGSQIIVNSGSVVVANDITGSGGTIKNLGEVQVLGDITNNSGVLFQNTSTGLVSFEGSAVQDITGTSSIEFYGTINIDNTSGVELGKAQSIVGTLAFTTGLLTLNAFDLTVATLSTHVDSAAGASKYIKTNSTGLVKRTVADSDVLFPVGITAYNPLTLNNAGTSDTYNVRVVDAEPAGASTAHMVDRSWVVTDDVADGSDLTVTPQWNSGAEELTNFDRDNCSVGLTTNSGTDYTWTETGAATGADPYTKAGASFTTLGTFAVGDYYYSGKRLDLKFFLAGAYNGTTMDQDLKTADLVPTTDPYGISGETTTVPATAVDWVKVVLRDAATPTTLVDSFAFFVDVNGDLLDRDGNAGGLITGVSLISYNISVMHRNHFGVMTSSTINLNTASPSWDFSTGIGQAWEKSGVTNDAMVDLGSGVYGLWDGDANADGNIVYNGGNSDRAEILTQVGGLDEMSTVVSNVYHVNDINMNGNVVYNGGSSDRAVILENVGGLDEMSTVLNAHMPE